MDTLIEQFKLTKRFFMKPRYNIAPNQWVPIIHQTGEIEFMHWGFSPRFLPKETMHSGFINVRSETIQLKPSFKAAFQSQRGLLIADGFYEWKKIGRVKQPFFIRRKDNNVFAFAAIWEKETCAILTTQSNDLLSKIHERMPVIIFETDYERWLNPKTKIDELIPLFCASESALWEVFPVTPKMNNPNFETIECTESLQ